MVKYRLLEPFVTHEAQFLMAGTEIGKGTNYPHTYADGSPRPPSRVMEPLDDEAKHFKESFARGVWPPGNQEDLAKDTPVKKGK